MAASGNQIQCRGASNSTQVAKVTASSSRYSGVFDRSISSIRPSTWRTFSAFASPTSCVTKTSTQSGPSPSSSVTSGLKSPHPTSTWPPEIETTRPGQHTPLAELTVVVSGLWRIGHPFLTRPDWELQRGRFRQHLFGIAVKSRLRAPNTTGTSSTVNYVHADGLGTPRVISDAIGVTKWQWSYQSNPFGEQQPVSSAGYVFNLRLPGQYFDAESGLMYNDARYYEPSTGRFPQPDPSGFNGGIGLYVYGLNNPLMYVDPLGLQALPNPGFPATGPAPAPLIGPVPGYGPPANDPVIDPEAPGAGGLIELCASNPIICGIGIAIYPTDVGGPQDEAQSNVLPFPKTHRPIPNQCPVDENGKEDRCAALYNSTLNTCASLKGKKRFMCLAAARENYKQCMEEE